MFVISMGAGFRSEVRFGNVLSTSRMQSRVPRCLFGVPKPKETIEIFQDAMETERRRFSSRWGVDPCCPSEDKENFQSRTKIDRAENSIECSPRKNRNTPYSRQTSIHDYWRSRKAFDVNKKGLTGSTEVAKKGHDGRNSSSTTK